MRKLIVMPDDSIGPLLDLIGSASRSLRVKIFSLSDARILSALVKAHKRKVKIRVLLNPARRNGEIQNRGARSVLEQANIDVLDTNPAFAVTHEKSMVIDDETVWIGSLNWDPANFEEERDFAIVSTEGNEVAEVADCFDADWSRQPFDARQSSALIWCPGGREKIAAFIDGAKHSLFIQSERFQDALIGEHLVRAKLRGVKVHVMTRLAHSLRAKKLVEGLGSLRIMRDVGIGVRKVKHQRLHAKVLLADKARAIVGSINLTASSFDDRRELAIHVKEASVMDRLTEVIHDDWEHSRLLDLDDRVVDSGEERSGDEREMKDDGQKKADSMLDLAK